VLSGATRLFPLGAIAGEVIGSVHERAGTKITDFALFTPANRITDDSVLTVAVAEVLASGGNYTPRPLLARAERRRQGGVEASRAQGPRLPRRIRCSASRRRPLERVRRRHPRDPTRGLTSEDSNPGQVWRDKEAEGRSFDKALLEPKAMYGSLSSEWLHRTS
jgi:hypothetical protein